MTRPTAASARKPAPRIASLLASGTEIVVELGLEEQLVAISHECDYPPRVLDRPRVSRPRFEPQGLTSGELDAAVRAAMAEHGSVYLIDDGMIGSLAPDLILAQAVCEVCAVPTFGVAEVVARNGLAAEVLSLDAHTIAEVLESILAVGAAAGVAHRAGAFVAMLRARLDRVRRRIADAGHQRVLAIEWFDPPFVPGHWVPEMIEIAGGECLAGEAGRPSRQVTWNELAGLDPDVLLLMPCGYDLETTRADAGRFADRLTAAAPRAIAAGRAFVVDGSSYFNRSGPRVIDGVEILAGLLHPERSPSPPVTVAERWDPLPVS
jgi:iron complex transport system substrate-binding protein